MFSIVPNQNYNSYVIEKLLNLNILIEENIFKKTKFIDSNVEKAFLNEENILDEKFKIKTDLMIIIGWISMLIYIYLVFYRQIYIYSCSILCVISLFISIYRYLINDRKLKLIVDHVQVFLPILYLNLKALHLIIFLSDNINDNDNEIIRIIIYNWVTTTILIIQKLDGRPWVYLFFTIFNFITIIIVQLYSYNNHFYYLDAICSLIVAGGGYILKKHNEIKIRIIYGQKFKNEKMSNYFLGFINGLNGFFLNLKNDETISFAPNLKNEMESLNISNEQISINSFSGINDEVKETEKLIFMNSCNESSLPRMFLNSLIYNDNDVLHKEEIPILLKNNSKTETLFNKLKSMQSTKIESNPIFKNIGIYFINSSTGLRYYEVYYRKVDLSNNDFIYDLVFYKVNDLIVSLINIEKETQKKKDKLGKLVHEFKTPLNSILGLIYNIKKKKIDEITIKKDLNMIKNLSKYVIFLINDIIHYSSRKNSEDLNVIMQKINIRKIVSFTFKILNSLLCCNDLKSKSINTELEFDDNLYSLKISADETRLKQILLNLISNSVKFTKSGFIMIKCFKDYEKELIIISIKDSGIGIKDENKKYIFSDYFMDSDGYQLNPQGTGIGLNICKNLANRMNMEIKFESKFGEGTEFIIEIPDIKKNTSIEMINTNNNWEKNKLTANKIHNTHNDESFNSTILKNNSINLINCEYNDTSKDSIRENIFSNACKDEFISIHKEEDNFHFLNPLKSYSLELPIYKHKSKGFSPNELSIFYNTQNQLISTNSNYNSSNQSNYIQFLIIDDDKYICNSTKILVERIFKEANLFVDIITGSDGFHIIQKVIEDQRNGNNIKCIITDEYMEYLNGSDAIKIIRNLEKDCKIKNVKIITATSQEDINSYKEINNGADIVISKPLSKMILKKAFYDLKIINQYLS